MKSKQSAPAKRSTPKPAANVVKAPPGPDDFIYGLEIAKAIRRSPQQTWYAASKGYIDVDKFGRLLRSTPRRLGVAPKETASQ
jgi:hypothetical protein